MSISVASIGFVLPPKPTAFAERGKSSPITPIYKISKMNKDLNENKNEFIKLIKIICKKIIRNFKFNYKYLRKNLLKGCEKL